MKISALINDIKSEKLQKMESIDLAYVSDSYIKTCRRPLTIDNYHYRGGSTWKPHVAPATTNLPSPIHTASAGNIAPVTKTSLAAKKQDGPHAGSGHNFSPKPFVSIDR